MFIFTIQNAPNVSFKKVKTIQITLLGSDVAKFKPFFKAAILYIVRRV